MSVEELAQAKRYRYLVCAVIFLGYVLVFFHRLCPAVIALDMQADFAVGGTLLGVLASAYFYSYAVMQIPTGLLADSWGPRKTVSSALALAAVGAVVMGLAPGLGLAVAGRIMVGVGVSTVFVCNFKILANWFCTRRFVVMGGLFMATGGVGALISAAPLAWLSDALGWRASLVLVGGATLAMSGLVWLVVRDRPQDKGWPAVSEVLPGAESARRIGLGEGMRRVVTAARFWPISLWAFCSTGLSFALGGLWGGPFLMQVYGMSKAQAGGILTAYAASLLLGAPPMGWAANRLGRKRVLMACSVVMCAACAAVWQDPDGLPPWALMAAFFAIGLAGAATGPVIAAVSKELFPLSIAGTSVGLVNLFPFFGAAVMQIGMGAVVEIKGQPAHQVVVAAYGDLFLVSLAIALASLGLSFLLTETLGRQRA
jgi:sugar phosphate permease